MRETRAIERPSLLVERRLVLTPWGSMALCSRAAQRLAQPLVSDIDLHYSLSGEWRPIADTLHSELQHRNRTHSWKQFAHAAGVTTHSMQEICPITMTEAEMNAEEPICLSGRQTLRPRRWKTIDRLADLDLFPLGAVNAPGGNEPSADTLQSDLRHATQEES